MVSLSALKFFSTALLAFAAVSLASPTVRVRDSPASLSVSSESHIEGGSALGLIERDLGRARVFAKGGHSDFTASTDSQPIQNDALYSVIQVTVGSSATKYRVLFDTASANLWVGAKQKYNPGKPTGESFHITYGSGSAQGTLYSDSISLGDNLAINQQLLGDANWTSGFQSLDVDGVVGLGPTILSVGKLTPSSDSPIPTVMDNLFQDKLIPEASVGIFLTPFDASEGGSLSWGQADTSKCTSPLTMVDPPSSCNYWSMNQEVKYGDQTILSSSLGIIDSGSTLIYLSPDAFQKYQAATKATMNEKVGLLELPESEFANLKSMYFLIGGATFELNPDGQIWKRSLNPSIGGGKDKIYLVFRQLEGVEGISVINGFLFMQRFYIYLNSSKRQVGIANTANTLAKINY